MDEFFIDINCDVGEGIGNERDLMPFISSCNIACGGHAGDSNTMSEVVRLAKQHQVKVGAHPSYPDKKNFGRVSMDISKEQLLENIQRQLQDFSLILDAEDVPLHHIKAHGALYNDIAKDIELAKTFLEAIDSFKNNIFLYAPYGSVIEQNALEQVWSIKREAFADRNYNEDLSLVSRKLPNALLEEPEEVLDHIVRMIKNNRVKTVNGGEVPITAETFCVHGDTVSALQILNYLSRTLPDQHIYLRK